MTAITAQNTAHFALPTVVDGYAAYLRAINDIPELAADEERQLAISFRQKNDIAAARKLALSHLRLVARVARGYNGYGIEQSDLVQEGNIGLLKAVKKFDPDRGARLATFAVYWIRAEIYNFILRNWRIVKIATTKAQRKLFFNMRRLFEKDAAGVLQSPETVAHELGVRARDVTDMRRRVHNTNSIALSPIDGESEQTRYAEWTLQSDSDPEEEMIAAANAAEPQVAQALTVLDARSREIVEMRHLREPAKTLHDLARRFDISAERVRQIETRALEKMRQHLSAA